MIIFVWEQDLHVFHTLVIYLRKSVVMCIVLDK